MIRIWLLSFTVICSVSFLGHSPDNDVFLPYANQVDYKGKMCCKLIPAEVFYFHLYQHLGLIVIAGILISLILWPLDRQYLPAFIVFLIIQIVDIILYRIFYRGWFWQAVPWNVVKVFITGVVTIWLQFRIRPISL